MEALHSWSFAVWLRSSAFAYPVLETVHIIALATVFGTILMVDWAILRRREQIGRWLATHLPWTLAGFVCAALSGSLMFLARASDLIANRAFVLKMVLLFLAGTNAAMLHARGAVNASSTLTRAQAILSIALWIAIITCGRWIAYV
jgi:hypothetical protein